MSHGFELSGDLAQAAVPVSGPAWVLTLQAVMKAVNRWVMVPCMVAVLLAAGILTYSVAARYFFKIPTEWQDETAIFLLMGATFFSAAFVQSQRGHVGVEAIAGLLSPRVNHWRLFFVELVSAAFCTFFSWKSWTLFREALHEGHSSNSTWGPPMWIPYFLMAAGMTLLALQLWLEVIARLSVKTAIKKDLT
jgi:TRAP-type C4-dicarboxylate transport system permease small subunit